MWFGHPTNYEVLRVFMCATFIHMKQDMLEIKSIKCMFLVYYEGNKGYKIWNPIQSK